MLKQRPKIIFFGTSDFALPSLEKLLVAPFDLVGVICQPDRPQGRGLKCQCCAVKEKARAKGLPAWQPQTLKDVAIEKKIRSLKPDAMVVAAYGLMIPQKILEIPPYGVVNIHPSLLPLYRGPSPIQAALLDGAQETGVSLMLLDREMDHGPILVQEKIALTPQDDIFSLSRTLANLGAEILAIYLPPYLEGKIKPRAQEHHRATFTKMIKKENGRIDWAKPAQFIERQVRAYLGWPGGFTQWGERRLIILGAVARETDRYREENGSVFAIADQPYVQCGTGVLGLKKLQLAGKGPATGAEFLRGYPEFIGGKLH